MGKHTKILAISSCHYSIHTLMRGFLDAPQAITSLVFMNALVMMFDIDFCWYANI